MQFKILFFILVLQVAGRPATELQHEDTHSVRFVRSQIDRPQGVTASFAEKRLNRLGDRVSIAILKIFDDNRLSEPLTVKRVLPLVRSAFQYPRAIPNEEDRDPRITLLLLGILAANAKDSELKAEIRETSEFIRRSAK